MTAIREIDCEITLAAPINGVWEAWTTEQGAVTFFAPAARIETRPGGSYELFFNPYAPVGEQGSEGMRIMAMQPPVFLSFTWNAPPHFPEVRGQMTFVEVHLSPISADETSLRLRHLGWGEGEEWQAAFDYFSQAWPKVVLTRLRHSLENAPVDWSNPPRV